MTPHPPRRIGRPWIVFPLIAVLVAAGVVLALSGDDDPVAEPSGCTGSYCVGAQHYANACAAFGTDGLWQLFPGADGTIRVKETFADGLPANATNVEASCELAPLSAKGSLSRIELHLRELSTAASATVSVPGTPLPAVPGAVVVTQDEVAEAHWVHATTSVKLTVAAKNGQPRVTGAALSALAKQVDTALATPKGRARPVPGGTRGDAKVQTDACAVFTGEDFQRVTRYVVNPGYVQREYSLPEGYDEELGSSCHRYTARADSGYPKAPGTDYLDGLLAPEVTVYPAPDPASAQRRFAADKSSVSGTADVSGIGDAAAFGPGGVLEFVVGFHVVKIDCPTGASSPGLVRPTLVALAQAIIARM